MLIVLTLAACDPGFSEDECTDGEKWCEGDDLMVCVHEGHDVTVHTTGEVLFWCDQYGGYCGVQNGMAGCVMDDAPCPDDVSSLCIGNYLCGCVPGELPVLAESQCTVVNTLCAESGTIDGSAFCAASSEPCTEDGLNTCFEDDGGAFEVHVCENGVWMLVEECVEPDTSCVQLPDGGAECQP